MPKNLLFTIFSDYLIQWSEVMPALGESGQVVSGLNIHAMSVGPSWTPNGYSRPPVRLFTLGFNLAKSTSLTTRKKVANHSP
jgi:hypothetical protein